MNETYELSLWLHLGCVKLVILLLGLHICLVFIGDTAKFAYIKRLMFFLPTYYFFLALVFFTGILNLSFLHFSLSFSISIMIICWILLIPLGAIGFKRLKRLRFNKEFGKFKKFMLAKIIGELILVIFPTIIGILY